MAYSEEIIEVTTIEKKSVPVAICDACKKKVQLLNHYFIHLPESWYQIVRSEPYSHAILCSLDCVRNFAKLEGEK